MSRLPRQQLRCPACDWTEPCGAAEMARRLKGLGMLKREREPDADTMVELLRTSLSRLACPECEAQGVLLESAPDDEWDDLRSCASCGKTISRERLEIFPTAERCAACQAGSETGELDEGQPEYCSRCGSVMQVRAKGGSGLARYVMMCPDCGR